MDVGFREQMRKLVHFWIEVYRREPDLMTVMINEVTRSYEFLESHDIGTVMVAFEAIEQIIRKARDRGEVGAGVDPQLASYVVFGAAEMLLSGYVMGTLRRSDPEPSPATRRRCSRSSSMAWRHVRLRDSRFPPVVDRLRRRID